jgi:signal transduction histidine kinase
MRLARLSVLQELAVAALELASPRASVDDFLQHVSERMGCVAALWLGCSEGRSIELLAAAGISRQARALPIEAGAGKGCNDVRLPYPALDDDRLRRWLLELPQLGGEHHLALYFGPDSRAAHLTLESMARRVADVFQSAIAHRHLYVDLQRSYHELEKAQQANVMRERLAALGEMAAVVAHEVRNPLGAIFNSLATLKKVAPADEGNALELLGIVEEEASRVNRIIMDLLEFAKPGEAQLEKAPIDVVIDAVVDAADAARMVPEGIEVSANVEDDLPAVGLDVRLMRQALLNLVQNAIQVSPIPGRVLVRASSRVEEGRRQVCVSITDEGPGVEAEKRKRIFEPFFTTKGSGTGLGLAIVERIVDAHHGRIDVDSPPGSGATFTVVLPVAT